LDASEPKLMIKTLIAREDELDRAMHSLRFSGGVLIAGEAGVGKTALASSVVERLPMPPVGWIVATSASRETPLGALTGFLPSDLATIHPALVAQHVDARLRELSRSEQRSSLVPVLVVDDAQLLDPQSAAVLLSLVTAKSLRLLATMRSGGDPSDAVTALWKEQLIDRLDLAPLGHEATRELLESLLGGPVASGTVEMLWTISHGNPFYVTELARYGADHGQLESKAGVWWWLGDTGMPPRLGELLERRIEALSPSGREAVDVLALGEPLPYETLSAVVNEDAILELDHRKIITSDEQDGVLLLRFSHPLLHTVAERQLGAARRRALAGRLRNAPAQHVDILRRATWEEASSAVPTVDLLLAAADAVLLNDPAAAVRLASRAQRVDPTIRSSLLLCAAQSETGRPDLARRVLDAASSQVSDDDDRYAYGLEDLGLSLWGERRPDRAWEVLTRLRAELPESFLAELNAAEAVIRLFTGGCHDVVPIAQSVLDADPTASTRIWALTCLTGALAFADRGPEALVAGQRLLDALSAKRVTATRAGLAYALIATTGLFYGAEYRLPRPVGRSGRWPGEPDQPGGRAEGALTGSPVRDDVSDIGWPLLVGVRRHLQGDLEGALSPLREAYVQQQSGQGLFRSESTAELIVVLAELGHEQEAASILRDSPPDAVAIIPGLRDWATAAVEAAGGRHSRAAEDALKAARTAASRGAAAMAMNFLTDVGRYGDPVAAARALPELGLSLDTDVQRVRAVDVTARAQRDPAVLLQAAQAQLLAGFSRHAYELAELVRSVEHKPGHEREAAAVVRQARERLSRMQTATKAFGSTPLTQRETEVARLASNGLSDREIAEELFVSIRTVQSHLASAYRKLGIASRSELAKVHR
jgi:DNA-binding NarL/FixJ family response regulator